MPYPLQPLLTVLSQKGAQFFIEGQDFDALPLLARDERIKSFRGRRNERTVHLHILHVAGLERGNKGGIPDAAKERHTARPFSYC